MGVQIPVGEMQVSIRWACNGVTRPMYTTFGVSPDATAPSGVLPKLDDIHGFLVSSTLMVASQISNQYTYVSLIGQEMTGSGILSAERPANIVGTNAFQPPPPNTSWVVQKRTLLGGRKNRGRMYVPPARLGETVVNAAGVIDAANVTAEQDDWTAFLGAMSADDYPLVVFHSDGSPSTVVSSLVVENRVGTQRRRLRS